MSTDHQATSAPSRPAVFRSALIPGLASAVLLLAAVIFGLGALLGGEETRGMWILCGIFLLPAVGLGRAAVLSRRRHTSPDEVPRREVEKQTVHGMYPILVSLTSVYCWILVVGMQVFAAINGGTPDNTKWYVTLGLAIAAFVFMRFHGNTVLQRNFAGTSPQAVTLTPIQSFGVVVFVLAAGLYLSWIVFW